MHMSALALLHGAVIWIWHTPKLYVLALDNLWWHAFEHACFLFTGWLFWWSVLRANPKQVPQALMAVLLTLMHTGLLGALLTDPQVCRALWGHHLDAGTDPDDVAAFARRLLDHADGELWGGAGWLAGRALDHAGDPVAAEAVLTDVFLSAEGGVLKISSEHSSERLTITIEHPELSPQIRRMHNLSELLERFVDGYEISATRTVLMKDLRRR